MMRSASGTYSLPSACMKSCWVSTSQKMTRGMARNLFEDMGTCQQLDAQTQQTRRRTEVNSASEQVFRWLTSVFPGASVRLAIALPTASAPLLLRHSSSAWDTVRSEEHTSELQSQSNLVCRLLLEKKKSTNWRYRHCQYEHN